MRQTIWVEYCIRYWIYHNEFHHPWKLFSWKQMSGAADFLATYIETGDAYGLITDIIGTLPCATIRVGSCACNDDCILCDFF